MNSQPQTAEEALIALFEEYRREVGATIGRAGYHRDIANLVGSVSESYLSRFRAFFTSAEMRAHDSKIRRAAVQEWLASPDAITWLARLLAHAARRFDYTGADIDQARELLVFDNSRSQHGAGQ